MEWWQQREFERILTQYPGLSSHIRDAGEEGPRLYWENIRNFPIHSQLCLIVGVDVKVARHTTWVGISRLSMGQKTGYDAFLN